MPDSKRWESSGLLKTEWWGSFHSQGAHSEKPTQIEFCTTPVATNELTRPVQHIPSTTKRLKAQSKMPSKMQMDCWIQLPERVFLPNQLGFCLHSGEKKKQGNAWGKKTSGATYIIPLQGNFKMLPGFSITISRWKERAKRAQILAIKRNLFWQLKKNGCSFCSSWQ